jgi:threonine/homoserine/homoserine lactone efflux protein
MPKWMNGIAGFTPGKSLIVGIGIGAFNPKNIIVGAAAAAIASASLSAGQVAGAIAVYVLVAVLGVAAPFVVTLAMARRLSRSSGRDVSTRGYIGLLRDPGPRVHSALGDLG